MNTYKEFDKTKKKLLKYLNEGRGIVSYACSKAGVSRQTFYNYKKEDDAFSSAVDEISEEIIDVVESKLLNQINENNLTAIIFFLKTKGRSRGYVEMTDSNVNLNGGIKLRPLTNEELDVLRSLNEENE